MNLPEFWARADFSKNFSSVDTYRKIILRMLIEREFNKNSHFLIG